MSSRKLQAGTRRGELGSASDTRLCFNGVGDAVKSRDEVGNGALKEKVEAEGIMDALLSMGFVMVVIAQEVNSRWCRRKLD